MDITVTTPKQITSPTQGPPAPHKQAQKLRGIKIMKQ